MSFFHLAIKFIKVARVSINTHLPRAYRVLALPVTLWEKCPIFNMRIRVQRDKSQPKFYRSVSSDPSLSTWGWETFSFYTVADTDLHNDVEKHSDLPTPSLPRLELSSHWTGWPLSLLNTSYFTFPHIFRTFPRPPSQPTLSSKCRNVHTQPAF